MTDRVIPLTPLQEEAFSYLDVHKNDTSLNISFALKFKAMNRILIEKSLNILIARHEILRARFTRECVHIEDKLNLEVRHVSSPSLINGLMDIRSYPLIRSGFYGDDWYISISHILTDGYGISILLKEFIEIYESLMKGIKPDTTSDDLSRAFIPRETYRTNLEYFIKFYGNKTCSTLLPSDFKRNGEPGGEGGSFTFDVPLSLFLSSVHAAHKLRVSPYVYFAGAFMNTLMSITGNEEAIIGTNFSSRTEINKEAVNLYTTLVPIYIKKNHDLTAYYKTLNTIIKDAKKHEAVTLSDLKDNLNLSINNIFTMEDPSVLDLKMNGSPIQLRSTSGKHSSVDFTVCFFPSFKSPRFLVFFRRDLFKFSTVRGWISQYMKELHMSNEIYRYL